jgi:uncharacterized delta-60 repeat protein
MRRLLTVFALGVALPVFVIVVSPPSVATPGQISRLPITGADDMNDSGRFVVFTSDVARVFRDTNGEDDVYLLDRSSGSIGRISVSSSGAQANGASRQAHVSANGRYVVFTSDATNLVPSDTNGATDVFIRDRWARTTRRISLTGQAAQANGPSSGSAISADGRYVTFHSHAPNLSVSPEMYDDDGIYVRDRVGGTTRQLGFNEDYGSFSDPVISADGRFILWVLNANGTSGDCDWSRITIVDRVTDTDGTIVSGDCSSIDDLRISGEGRYVGWSWRPSAPSLPDSPFNDPWSRVTGVLLDRTTGEQTQFPGEGFALPTSATRSFTGGDALRAIDTATGRIEVLRVPVPGWETAFQVIDASGDGSAVLVRTSSPRLVAGDASVTPDVFLVEAAVPPPTPLLARGRDVTVQADGKIVVAATVEDATGDLDVVVLRYLASGILDTTFSGDGIRTLDVRGSVEAQAIAVQGDGKIVVAMRNPLREGRIVRLTPTGALDRSFARNGTFKLDGEPQDLLVQADGRIVVTDTAWSGTTYFCQVNEWTGRPCASVRATRLKPSGALDPTFAGGQTLLEIGYDDGTGQDLFAAGISRFGGDYYVLTSNGVVRFTGAGAQDTSFGSASSGFPGFTSSDCRAQDIAIAGGKVVVGGIDWMDGHGDQFCAARFTSTGLLDASFGVGGEAKVAVAARNRPVQLTGIGTDAQGRVVLAGWADPGTAMPQFAVARLTAGGTVDGTFSSDGVVRIAAAPGGWSQAADLVVDASSRPLLVGKAVPSWDRSLEVALVRLTETGAPDGSFGDGDGRLTTRFVT